jgi:hypothetical protein
VASLSESLIVCGENFDLKNIEGEIYDLKQYELISDSKKHFITIFRHQLLKIR